MEALSVAVVPPLPRFALVTVPRVVPPMYGSASGVVEYLNNTPYKVPMPAKPDAVSVNVVVLQTVETLLLRLPMVGQVPQLPGPVRE